jgi:quercetin dioxygenase-like cupin family protein
MAIPHTPPGEPVDVTPLGPHLSSGKTHALFKSLDLEVIRLILRAGKSLPLHRVPGELTIHLIEGTLDVAVEGQSRVLRAGKLICQVGGARHSVRALEDASALVTIALRNQPSGGC